MSRIRTFSRQASADIDHTVGWLLDHGGAATAAEQLLAQVLAAAERPAVGASPICAAAGDIGET